MKLTIITPWKLTTILFDNVYVYSLHMFTYPIIGLNVVLWINA